MSQIDIFGAGLSLGIVISCGYYFVCLHVLDRVDRRKRWRHGR